MLSASAEKYEDFARFERWISSCLMEERVIGPREFLHLERTKVAVASEFVA